MSINAARIFADIKDVSLKKKMKRKRLHCALCLELEWVESGDGVVSVQVKTEHSFCTGFLINTYCWPWVCILPCHFVPAKW